jgi:hypothetical protein
MSVNYNGKTSPSGSIKTYYSNASLNNNILWSTSTIINDNSLNQNVIVPASPYYSNVYIPGDLYLDGNFINASDILLKTNLESISKEEHIKLLNLNTYSYTFKDDLSNKKHYGLIAQEVEEEFPELVFNKPNINNNQIKNLDEDEDNDQSKNLDQQQDNNESKNLDEEKYINNINIYKGVNYLELIPLLVNTIQIQQKQINELENKLTIFMKKF